MRNMFFLPQRVNNYLKRHFPAVSERENDKGKRIVGVLVFFYRLCFSLLCNKQAISRISHSILLICYYTTFSTVQI